MFFIGIKQQLIGFVGVVFLALGVLSNSASAQSTFKAGWNTYNTGMIIHEYNYKYMHSADGPHLYATDSALTFVDRDSLVTMRVAHNPKGGVEYKTINYMNPRKYVIKKEEYSNGNMVELNTWKYDDKNRMTFHLKQDKTNGYTYKKNYRYEKEKNGGYIMFESSYFNGRIEFYTKYHYDSKKVLVKEVRLNDNNKDVVHVETYTYGENGKVKERSVYFPEFRVTKTFKEPEGNVPAKCSATMAAGIKAIANPATKISYIKGVIMKNLATISDPECSDFDFTFSNKSNCSVRVASTKINNGRIVCYQFREKM